MSRSLCAVVVWLSMFAVVTPVRVAEAGPFRVFFQSLRSAIAHPNEKPRSHRRSHKHNETPPHDASDSQTLDTSVPAPPGRTKVRVAEAASGPAGQKPEVPYGRPGPGTAGAGP